MDQALWCHHPVDLLKSRSFETFSTTHRADSQSPSKPTAHGKDNDGKIEAKPLKFLLGGKMLGNAWNKYIAQLPETLNQMFKSQKTARFFEKISGFQAIRDGAAKGQRIANDISQAYYDKFIDPGSRLKRVKQGDTKTMPNGKRFNDVSNDVERGLFAFMRRTVDGTE